MPGMIYAVFVSGRWSCVMIGFIVPGSVPGEGIAPVVVVDEFCSVGDWA